jgi:hypothetical protein
MIKVNRLKRFRDKIKLSSWGFVSCKKNSKFSLKKNETFAAGWLCTPGVIAIKVFFLRC